MGHYASGYRNDNKRLRSVGKVFAVAGDDRFVAEHIIVSAVAVVSVEAMVDGLFCHTSLTFDSLVLCQTMMIDDVCDQPKVTARGVDWL